MKEWRYRRLLFNLVSSDYENTETIVEQTDERKIVDKAVKYFQEDSGEDKLYYPSKSYAVAIIYAKLLSEYFDENFYSYLKKIDLLDRDKYFRSYKTTPEIYESILDQIDINNLDYSLPDMAATKRYFQEEFLLNDHKFAVEHKDRFA